MGTQFWWFYDVLLLAAVGITLYSAISQGLNKILLSFIGVLAALAVGIGVSNVLARPVYDALYSTKIVSTTENILSEWDLYTDLSEALRSFSGEEEEMDAPESLQIQEIQNLGERIASGEGAPEWFRILTARQLQKRLESKLSAHSEVTLENCMDQDALEAFLNDMHTEAYRDAADRIEDMWYCPAYRQLVRIALLLLLELAVMIVTGIIVTAAGNLEEQMHIRRFNHLLAFPVGLIESGVLVLSLLLAVKLLIRVSDGQMLLFNYETIAETRIFRFLYAYIQ